MQPPERYAELSDQQAQASQKFSENVLDSVDRWSLHVTDAARLDGLMQQRLQLKGLHEELLDAAARGGT